MIGNKGFDLLMNLQLWKKINLSDKKEYLMQLTNFLDKVEFSIDEIFIDSDYPRIVQNIGGATLFYRIIFSHISGFGLSNECYKKILTIDANPNITLAELSPYYEREVNTFAISEHPILEREFNYIVNKCDVTKETPVFFSRDSAEDFLKKIGARFALETEWEAAVKQGKDILFPFGNSIPNHNELDLWFNFDYQIFKNMKIINGLSGLFFGEWCGDLYSSSHNENAEVKKNEYVIKGGGAYFWPWQADEWVWCLCAMRMPSGDLIDGTSVLRPVLSL